MHETNRQLNGMVTQIPKIRQEMSQMNKLFELHSQKLYKHTEREGDREIKRERKCMIEM